MNTPHDIGKAITQNFKFASRVGAECESLTKVIKEELSAMLTTIDIPKGYKAKGGWDEDCAYSDDGWTCIAATYSLPMIYRHQRVADKYLFFQISLTGDGIEAKGNDEPLIHVGWWEHQCNFNEYYMGFPLDDDDTKIFIDSDCLVYWLSPKGTSEHEWVYSLRLTDINSQQDIQKNIVEPVKALLRNESNAVKALLLGKSTAEAFAGTKAVRYQKVEGEPGQLRTLPR